MSKINTFTLLAVTIALTGCGAAAPTRPANTGEAGKLYDFTHLKPANHKTAAETFAKLDLKDPYTAKITVGSLEVKECHVFSGKGWPWVPSMPNAKLWSAAVTINAKNSFGAYVGDRMVRYYFDDKQVVGSLQDHNICVIGGWPELLKRAK